MQPTYLKVRWIHDFPDEPVELYSELDPDRYEVRKVEVFRDGRRVRADESTTTGGTLLGVVPAPTLEEIAEDGEFEPSAISRVEFEEAWQSAAG
ncbi:MULTISPECIES: DUF6881 domain-containing protein [unclassified Kribbella]|uniref:DUF6881 domain-containing protein n=1 Tax=unclassified Kribbella TaxID=2644121 RepID=UPI00301B38CC